MLMRDLMRHAQGKTSWADGSMHGYCNNFLTLGDLSLFIISCRSYFDGWKTFSPIRFHLLHVRRMLNQLDQSEYAFPLEVMRLPLIQFVRGMNEKTSASISSGCFSDTLTPAVAKRLLSLFAVYFACCLHMSPMCVYMILTGKVHRFFVLELMNAHVVGGMTEGEDCILKESIQ